MKSKVYMHFEIKNNCFCTYNLFFAENEEGINQFLLFLPVILLNSCEFDPVHYLLNSSTITTTITTTFL